MISREEMLESSEVSGVPEKELECIYQMGEDAPFITITAYCSSLTLLCC